MSKFIEYLGIFLVIVGALLLTVGQIGSIGYGLYLWAHGTELSMAAWIGFLTWAKCTIIGVVSLGIGAILKEV